VQRYNNFLTYARERWTFWHRGGQNDTQGWTKWHENGQFDRDRGVGTEIATFKVKTFKSDLLKQADYCKAATTPTDRKQRKIV
jgi:hypothetical protein